MTSPPPPPGVPPQEPQWRPPSAYPPPRDGRGASFFVAIFLGILLLVSGGLNVLLLLLSIGSFAGAGLAGGAVDETGAVYDLVRVGGDAGAEHKVLRIPIHGAIAELENPLIGASGGTVSMVRRALRYAKADESVRGILLDIDSPGGGVTDSDEVYNLLRAFARERPQVAIVALFGDLAASGGYYVAVAAQRIVARRSSITGSIGVIMSAWNFAGAARELGIEQVAIMSEHTPYKDMLSPLKPVSPEERALLQGIVEELYELFVDVVDEGRGDRLTRPEVKALANGAIYSARQALELRLVDEIGDQETVEAWFRERMDDHEVVEYRRRPTLAELLFGMRTPARPAPGAALAQLLTSTSGPRFLYYWQGAR